jgi:acetyl-CoA carboxylase carboxyl transferase subunit alpha
MATYLEFEKPIEELELKIEELRRLSNGTDLDLSSDIGRLEKKVHGLRVTTYKNLTRWQKTQLARHPERPYTLDYIKLIVDDFIELHGDRRFADDAAIVAGLGRIGEVSCMIVGHQKGRGVKERIHRNFGQPHPEGYRKALRLMKVAERFGLPVITFIDTPGAYPGIGAEERGQAEAIATNLMEMSGLKTPIIAVVIGEGGSGGALALGVSDRLYMLEHSTYSVISPEGCASILWAKNGDLSAKDFAKAADALKLTSDDLISFGVAADIIPEPLGGAHRDPAQTAENIKAALQSAIKEFMALSTEELTQRRYESLRALGEYQEKADVTNIAPTEKPEDKA